MPAQLIGLKDPAFVLQDVLDACPGLEKNTLQTWIGRKVIPLDAQPPGTGRTRYFSALDIIKLATIQQFTLLKIAPSIAGQLAELAELRAEVMFSDEGHTGKPTRIVVYPRHGKAGWDGDLMRALAFEGETAKEKMKGQALIHLELDVDELVLRVLHYLHDNMTAGGGGSVHHGQQFPATILERLGNPEPLEMDSE